MQIQLNINAAGLNIPATMLFPQKFVAIPSWCLLLREHQLDSVEAVYRFTGGDVVTRSGTTEVRRITLKGSTLAQSVFLKKYWANNAAQLWRGMFRGTFFGRSKARREFENLERLQRIGLDAPTPIAYGEARRAGWLTRSFLISEGIPDPVPLDLFIRDSLPALSPDEQKAARRELIDRLADYTRRLHEQRFVHHDYFWRNIILSGHSLDHFYLIDAHKGGPWLPGAEQRHRAKDLATLDAPAPHFFRRTQRLRFFLRYAGHQALTDADKKLIRSVLHVASPLRERQWRRIQERRPIEVV